MGIEIIRLEEEAVRPDGGWAALGRIWSLDGEEDPGWLVLVRIGETLWIRRFRAEGPARAKFEDWGNMERARRSS